MECRYPFESRFKDGREFDDTQCRDAVERDFARAHKDLLFEIYKEATYEGQRPDARISKTIAKASTLFARLSADQERISRRLLFLTWVIVGLTVALVYLTVLLYCAAH